MGRSVDKDLVRQLLVDIGEDPEREGLRKTPERVARALEFLTQGYAQEPADVVGDAKFVEDYSEMIIVRDIDFFSMCEHHMMPFYGRAHVAYVPDGHIVGISKIARLVECFARPFAWHDPLLEQCLSCGSVSESSLVWESVKPDATR